ncbi:uncharacterized protein LOC116130497 [Pistacia vera]|uniref:uncharacterized protein LOC116130497 n=1 Tax=Pistacia vera TaxID=55513 RepID=UPI0012638D39|nr:uncharacterized protein LOC116130497 [Pistacia vera]
MLATVALGFLARSRRDSAADNVLKLQAFWAPFLLLHLGGPDTITAYALNDNEFWLRHFLQFVFQVGVAFYVFIPSWRNKDAFRFMAIPVFIAGIIKYGERILVLYSSSAKQVKDSLRSPHDFSNDPLKLENREKKEGSEKKSTDPSNLEDKKEECLYADLVLDHDERKETYSLLSKKSAKEAFKLVATELGFMYDSSYSPSDISITYVLLVGAIFLEVYAFIVLLFSDWTKYWLTKRNYMSINKCSIGLLSNDNKRWSGSIGQYNLLNFSLFEYKFFETSSMMEETMKRFGIKELIEKCGYLSWKEVDNGLLEMIFKQFLEKSKDIKEDPFDNKKLKELLGWRGDYVLSKSNYVNESHGSTIEVEFDYCLLLWHITTDLCCYDDIRNLKEVKNLHQNAKLAKGYQIICYIF